MGLFYRSPKFITVVKSAGYPALFDILDKMYKDNALTQEEFSYLRQSCFKIFNKILMYHNTLKVLPFNILQLMDLFREPQLTQERYIEFVNRKSAP